MTAKKLETMILNHAEAKAIVDSSIDPYRLVQAVEKAVLAKLASGQEPVWAGCHLQPTQGQIMTDKQLMQQALDVLAGCLDHPDAQDAIDALRKRLAQPEQEPVPAENCLWARNGNQPCSGAQQKPAPLKDYGLCPHCHSRTVTSWDGYVYCELGHRYLNSATSRKSHIKEKS